VRVVRLHGVGDVRVTDEPIPVPGPGESLVQVTAVGVCGSDLHWYADGGIGDATLDRPLVLGHEFAGVIRGGERDGERVAVDPAVPCEACDLCRAGHQNLCPTVGFAGHGHTDGALREFLVWPTALVHPLPEAVSDADGALLEPLGVALHAVGLGHLRAGATVGVFGCGPIGLLLVRLARLAGAGFVLAADPLPHRREAAVRYGADLVWDPTAGLDDLQSVVTGATGLGVDVAFEVAGVDEAINAGLVAARPGARVVLVGIPAGDTSAFRASVARRKGLTLVLSRRMNAIYPRAIRLVERGQVDLAPLVTARFPLAEAGAAMANAAARTGLKVVIEPVT
jgi:L-iditol 2-dehydrogenase